MDSFKNPFKPGAGHPPPHLAGRGAEKEQFLQLLKQDIILENLILTGLRGVGKTVLFDTFPAEARSGGWKWVGTDLSEAASHSEQALVSRIVADLSIIGADVFIEGPETPPIGFHGDAEKQKFSLNSTTLMAIYNNTPGLTADKLKAVLTTAWSTISQQQASCRGIVFAYDEAQTLMDNPKKEQYPLSLLLDVFQSLQKSNLPLMLALSGLPTLFPKLVDSRTYAERMFREVTLDSLSPEASREAILKPIETEHCPVKLSDEAVEQIYAMSGGYPYFIQFICHETYNALIQRHENNSELSVPAKEIQNKLDISFFSGRWELATDRQRDLLIAAAACGESQFSIREIAAMSEKILSNPFKGSSQIGQMLPKMMDQGLVIKNRHGRYSFAMPMFGQFIRRQFEAMSTEDSD